MSIIDTQNVLASIAHNPDKAVRYMLSRLEGKNPTEFSITDASTPFFASLEFAASLTADAINRNRSLERRLYPANAVTQEDLNLHRSDDDYVGTFARPSKTWFIIGLGLKELRRRAVPIPGSNSRKITIPRNTQINLSEYSFNLHYPIDIYVGLHDSISVQYDLREPSPLERKSSNSVDWRIVTTEGEDILFLTVAMDQVRLRTFKIPADNSSGFRRSVDFTSQFYYARVWHRGNFGKWEPMVTTYADKVYNPGKVTAVLKVIDQTLEVTIPQYYFNRNLVKPNIRIDVYETMGELEMSFDSYDITDFVADWRDYDSDDGNPYVAPLKVFETTVVSGAAPVSGGFNEMPLELQRDAVIWNHHSDIDLPITTGQLELNGKMNGFNLVKCVDVVTSRQFWATRELPAPKDVDGRGVAGSAMALLAYNFTDISNHDTVIDNGKRLTLLPTTLYTMERGLLKLGDVGLEASLRSMPPEDLAIKLNNSNYFYSPFTYVMDITGNHLRTRPYDFSTVGIESINFKDYNDSTGLIMTSYRYDIKAKADGSGFNLDLVTRGNKEWSEIDVGKLKAQISYVADGLRQRIYMTSSAMTPDEYSNLDDVIFDTVDDEMVVFRFNLTTTFDVDELDRLYLGSFKYIDHEDRVFPIDLRLDIDVVYIVEDYWGHGMIESAIDGLIAPQYLDPGIGKFIGITHETLDLKLGVPLKSLWTRSRTLILPDEFLTYEMDILDRYEHDVYRMDPNTEYRTRSFTYDPVTKKVTFNKLHNAGDLRLNDKGEEVILHHKGSTVLDAKGEPIPKGNERDLLRHSDILLVDAKYYLADSDTTNSYRNQYTETLVDWIVGDIPRINDRLIEQASTHIFYHPIQLAGDIEVKTDEGKPVRINAAQSITIKATFSKVDYENTTLRDSVLNRVVDVLLSNFDKTTIDVSTIIEEARSSVGTDALSIAIEGLWPEISSSVITLSSETDRLTLGKQAVALPDGKITVVDDVTFIPIRHA